MAEPLSLFDLLFPVKGREITATAERVGALPPPASTPPRAEPPPVQRTVAVTQPGAPFRIGIGTRLSDLVAAYVAAQAPGVAERVALELPTVVPAQAQALTTYQPPSGKTLILTAPIAMAARTHSTQLTATVTVDATVYPPTPMVEDDAIALGADAVIERVVSVEWANADWVDIAVVLSVQGIAVDSAVWAQAILPLAQAVYRAIQPQPVGGGVSA